MFAIINLLNVFKFNIENTIFVRQTSSIPDAFIIDTEHNPNI